jgi:hypothetical protein
MPIAFAAAHSLKSNSMTSALTLGDGWTPELGGSVPCSRRAASPSTTRQQNTRGGAGARVREGSRPLVVDDNKVNRLLPTRSLN